MPDKGVKQRGEIDLGNQIVDHLQHLPGLTFNQLRRILRRDQTEVMSALSDLEQAGRVTLAATTDIGRHRVRQQHRYWSVVGESEFRGLIVDELRVGPEMIAKAKKEELERIGLNKAEFRKLKKLIQQIPGVDGVRLWTECQQRPWVSHAGVPLEIISETSFGAKEVREKDEYEMGRPDFVILVRGIKSKTAAKKAINKFFNDREKPAPHFTIYTDVSIRGADWPKEYDKKVPVIQIESPTKLTKEKLAELMKGKEELVLHAGNQVFRVSRDTTGLTLLGDGDVEGERKNFIGIEEVRVGSVTPLNSHHFIKLKGIDVSGSKPIFKGWEVDGRLLICQDLDGGR
jgi:hypothetical protein